MKEYSKVQGTSKNRAIEIEHAEVGQEVNKVVIGAMWGLGALVGLWGVACFIGGMISVGGPVEFVKSWIAAVTGV